MWSLLVAIIVICFGTIFYLLYSQRISIVFNNNNESCQLSQKLSPSALLEFAHLIGNLKKTERSGSMENEKYL